VSWFQGKKKGLKNGVSVRVQGKRRGEEGNHLTCSERKKGREISLQLLTGGKAGGVASGASTRQKKKKTS